MPAALGVFIVHLGVSNRKRINDAKTALKIEQKDAKETKKGLCCLRFLLFELSAKMPGDGLLQQLFSYGA